MLNQKIKEVMQQLSRWFLVITLVINNEKNTAMSFHAWQNIDNFKPHIVFKDMDNTHIGATNSWAYISLKISNGMNI